MGPLSELPSPAPSKVGDDSTARWECKSMTLLHVSKLLAHLWMRTNPGVSHALKQGVASFTGLLGSILTVTLSHR